MLIAQNPIFRAVCVATVFWYAFLFVVGWVYGGVSLWRVVYVMPQSLLIAGIGTGIGLAFSLVGGIQTKSARGFLLKRGSTLRQVKFTMGSPINIPTQPQGKNLDDLLEAQKWWPSIKANAPEYADAIRAVLRVMNAIPRLPASPYPGGHGGRTLITHSMAVADQMLVSVRGWSYEGQKDKRGNVRIRLQEDRPHTFTPHDIPLLVLTGLAHDIGKITCYQPKPGQDARSPHGDVLHVFEAKPMHDMEGARLLRNVPEVMALPLADRTALLTAIGYYHHPFALPNANWVKDKTRSLTELLAVADIAVGTAEGHVLLDKDERMQQQDDDDAIIETGVMVDPVTMTEQTGAVPFSDENALLEATIMAGKTKTEAPPTPAPQPAKPVTSNTNPSNGDDVPRELSLFMTSITARDAINSENRASRIAWKHGGIVYAMEPVIRTLIKNRSHEDVMWKAEALADDSNGAKFTIALLKQLDARGMLIRKAFITKESREVEVSEKRALWKVRGERKGSEMVVFMLKASMIPGAERVPDLKEAPEIFQPLWGMGSVKRTPTASPTASQKEDGTKQEPVKQSSAPPPPSSPSSSDYDDADFPMAQPSAVETTNVFDDADAKSSSHTQQEVRPTEDEEVDLTKAVAQLLVTDAFIGAFPYETRNRAGIDYAVIPVDSPGGEAVKQLVTQYIQDNGVKAKPFKTVKMQINDDKVDAFLFALSDA